MNQNNVKIRNQALINSIKIGAKVGLLGPGPVLFGGMLGFGAMGQGSGLSIWHTTAISFFMYALPGQVVFIEMMTMGSAASAIAIAVALTSTRFLTMTLTLFPQIPKTAHEPPRLLMVHMLAMSTWTTCMRDFPKILPEHRYGYYIGIGLVCWLISVPSTFLGYLIADAVPPWVTYALVFVNPLFFLLSFTEVALVINRISILVGGIVGTILYPIYPDHALLITGIVFGTCVYVIDYVLRKRKQVSQ
ncbi:MAG: AzlC family ABC transporter permease [Polynucleobacter sp.]|jgi:predicted branched-subunit amino acid permease|nr:AzlC family ABC transporter permease [Polynucleobacter sp.]